jgi:hypothetical protein
LLISSFISLCLRCCSAVLLRLACNFWSSCHP